VITRTHVCSVPGCPQLAPCPTHARDTTGGYSERDKRAQAFFRKAVMARSRGVCERCQRAPATVAHHVRPGYDAECGLALCRPCHRAVDNKAR
jgi:hypothetical protein